MKTIKVTTDNVISVIDVDFDDYHSMQKEIGGGIEPVKTQILFDYFKQPMMMIVDDEGLIKNLPPNPLGCYFYGFMIHGNPIAGDFILAVPVGEDFVGLVDAELVKRKLMRDFQFLKEE